MTFLWNQDVFGWRMTGLLGESGRWFVGFSRAPQMSSDEKLTIRIDRTLGCEKLAPQDISKDPPFQF